MKGGYGPEYRTVVVVTTGKAGAVDESPRPERQAEHVVVNYSAAVPERLPRTMITKRRKLCSDVGCARDETRCSNQPQSDTGEKQRRNHSQRARGEKRKGSNKGTRTA